MTDHQHVPYRHRLAVYVVWHPKFSAGASVASSLYGLLSRDTASPLARGMGIPVLFRSIPAAGSPVPAGIPLAEARRTAVLVLVDDELVADDAWVTYVVDLWRSTDATGGIHRLYPVRLSPNAFKLHPAIAEVNFIQPLSGQSLAALDEQLSKAAQTSLSIAVVHELCRLIMGQPRLNDASAGGGNRQKVKIFISHTKNDGLKLAEGIKQYIHRNLQLNTFFDANDIPYGENFRRVLEEEIRKAALLIVQTDAYAASPWCLMELLAAKQHQRPVLVVNAVATGEERSPVYGGNVPTRRLEAEPEPQYAPIVEQMLLEVLRREHFVQHFQDLAALFGIPNDVKAIPYPPEPLTIADLRMTGETATTFVYPDPPINRLELERLRVLDGRITVTTPLLLLATGGRSAGNAAAPQGDSSAAAPPPTDSTGPTPRLSGLTVGLSIGNSPDLAVRGMSSDHVNDAIVAFALYLLASGAKLAYGGVPQLSPSAVGQPPDFLAILLDLVVAYARLAGDTVDANSQLPEPRLAGYIAAPYTERVDSAGFRAKWRWAFKVEKPESEVPAPADGASEAAKAYFVARSLTAMRMALAADVDAQVFVGGRVFGASGQYPGIIEELHLTLGAGKAAYVIGGFGGAAHVAVEALRGGTPAALTRAAHERETGGYADLTSAYDQEAAAGRSQPVDFEGVTRLLNETGVAGLAAVNGLTEEENLRLFETPHIPEMVYLVLKGLARVAARRGHPHVWPPS